MKNLFIVGALFVAISALQAQVPDPSPTSSNIAQPTDTTRQAAPGNFNLPPLKVFHDNDVILFIGDSITDGGWQPSNDYNHNMGQSYPYIISALVGAVYPERNLTFLNRGHSGNKVTDLAARWQKDVIDLKPNFLSIMVGVNDTLFDPNEPYEQNYDKLLTDTIAALPNTKIVLAEPFLLPVGKQKANYEANLAKVKEHQDVVTRLGAKFNLPVVHYQAAFDEQCKTTPPEHWSWDGIHPTYAGHGLMVREWLKVVDATWPNG